MKHLQQIPETGSYILKHQGDVLEIDLDVGGNRRGKAWLRTNIARAAARRAEVVAFAESGNAILGRDWHDIPMRHVADNRFALSMPLLEVGCFEAKAFFLPDGSSEPEWPAGKNFHIKVESADYFCNNTIYAAFVRQFGAALSSKDPAAGHAQTIKELDALGYSVIPRSGTFRDLIKELDFIMGKLRFRIIQLLPIHPTPTTYARMGRFGSPFAAMDFEEVDPALAEFDRRTTPLDQFQELVDAVHQRGGRLFIDIPSNHTGWAAHLQMRHPEWFVHNGDRTFQSPGAWGVTWEDLSQLDYKNLELWKYMAEVLLLWRRRGVDGFRCDAGYMIPYPAWEYIVAKVRNEFPDTVFLLEGLGGKAEVVESLLAGADLNWAYSELFQNYDRAQIESYLPGAMHVSSTRGTLVHFAETHDNQRLAARSHNYARMRTALCALASHNGSFGITNGVEWFADHKIDVHEASYLNWGSARNQVDHIARLNAILEVNPAFRPDASARMIQSGPGNVLVLLRESSEPVTRVLVVANLNDDRSDTASWKETDRHSAPELMHDLVSGRQVTIERVNGMLRCSLAPGEVLCLTPDPAVLAAVEQALQHAPEVPARQIAQLFRAKALEVYAFHHGPRDSSGIDLAGAVRELAGNPRLFCHSAAAKSPKASAADLARDLSRGGLPPVTTWEWPRDTRRTVMVPPGHFLYIRCKHRFTAELSCRDTIMRRETSLPQEDGSHFALLVPLAEPEKPTEYSLLMIVHEPAVCSRTTAPVIFLTRLTRARVRNAVGPGELRRDDCYALCTNGRGAMAQVRGAWGEIRTQYDALLAGNLHPAYPVDRHVMLTRCRGWIANKGYSLPINIDCLEKFAAGSDGVLEWHFAAPVGQGKIVNLQLRFWMHHGQNAVTLEISRKHALADSDELADAIPIKLILRPDIEDRSNHTKTKAYAGPEAAWQHSVISESTGFLFSPSPDRRLRMTCAQGSFTKEPEWSYMVAHPIDADRGFDGSSDLFSPGFFSADIAGGQKIEVQAEIIFGTAQAKAVQPHSTSPKKTSSHREEFGLEEAMRNVIHHFVVKRDELETVIAGYPWFLDWGRDTLICLRGLIAAGMTDESAAIIKQFARFEQGGTLPNMLRGNDSANRETSDAPLWLFVACSDLMRATDSKSILNADVGGRTVRDILRSIVSSYIKGTSNGVIMDPETGLVFSPAHFTWMDTNYPAGSPRQGYPIEIQALWYAALETLALADDDVDISGLAGKVRTSIRDLFTRSGQGYLSDCLHGPGGGAVRATPDDALRPNQLLAITLGAVKEQALQEAIVASCEELLVPGAIRTLADRPVKYALPVRNGGMLLNDPHNPYWGRYQGDEDTRRKPAYHNGTAWAWLYPSYSEALMITYGDDVRNTALSLLTAGVQTANTGCLGLIPEIVDGNTPHSPRGCGAQAWSVTELYRVLAVLKGK